MPEIKSKTNVEALALELGIATRTLFGWFRRGCPRDSAAAVRGWRSVHMQPRAIPGIGSPLREQEKRERVRKIKAETEGLRLRNAAKRAELYPADEVDANLAELLGMIRERLATLVDALADCFPPEL